MPVQKSRKSRSKRGARRAHSALKTKPIAIDKVSGEKHLYHHMTRDGYYRGKQYPLNGVLHQHDSDNSPEIDAQSQLSTDDVNTDESVSQVVEVPSGDSGSQTEK